MFGNCFFSFISFLFSRTIFYFQFQKTCLVSLKQQKREQFLFLIYKACESTRKTCHFTTLMNRLSGSNCATKLTLFFFFPSLSLLLAKISHTNPSLYFLSFATPPIYHKETKDNETRDKGTGTVKPTPFLSTSPLQFILC